MTKMFITVKMRAPKYIRGNYDFDSLEKLYDFLLLIRSVGKSNLSPYIFAVAKDGRLNISKYGFSIDAKMDCPDYALANTLAKKLGLSISWEGFRTDKIRDFCRAFDSAKS